MAKVLPYCDARQRAWKTHATKRGMNPWGQTVVEMESSGAYVHAWNSAIRWHKSYLKSLNRKRRPK